MTISSLAGKRNATTRGWCDELPDTQQQDMWRSLGRSPGAAPEKARQDAAPEVAQALMHVAWQSAAALAIAPLQDVLNLGNEARMNVPGRAEGNCNMSARSQGES
jgi:4-alpha-glucanotransferase